LKLVRARVFVFGFVQDSFRFSVKQKADSLGLKGWIRNLLDFVDVVFEGPEDKVKEMVEWCEKGPPTSRIDKTKVGYEEYRGEFKDFKII
jgi:acylphosphatase